MYMYMYIIHIYIYIYIYIHIISMYIYHHFRCSLRNRPATRSKDMPDHRDKHLTFSSVEAPSSTPGKQPKILLSAGRFEVLASHEVFMSRGRYMVGGKCQGFWFPSFAILFIATHDYCRAD